MLQCLRTGAVPGKGPEELPAPARPDGRSHLTHPTTDPDVLNPTAWDQLHSLASRLEEAWQRPGGADLAALLPAPDSPLRRPFLHELVKTELEIRYRLGRPWTLEQYLE